MGKNTFTVTVNETGQRLSCSVEIGDPEIVSGQWTSDKEGLQPLEEAFLGETVYFQVHTQNIADGQELKLKLYEQDKNIFMRDFLDPDDDEFPDDEVIKYAMITNDTATVELELMERWEPMIIDDSDNMFSLDEKLELYWEVSWQSRKKELPKEEGEYLKVGFSQRTLYFRTPSPSHNLPEMFDQEGNPLFLVGFGANYLANEAMGAAAEQAGKWGKSEITRIALARLDNGDMVDNTGKVYTGNPNRTMRSYRGIYSNEGEFFENARQGRDFGYNHGSGPHTTSGISQYDYFSKHGNRVRVLGLLKHVGNVLNIFNFVKAMTGGIDSDEPFPFELGPVTILSDVVGILVKEQKAESDLLLEESIQAEIDAAKLQGLEATRKAVDTWNHNEDYNWQLLPISSITANQLLAGKFKTFEEFQEYEDKNIDSYSNNIEVLYRETKNDIRNEFVYIIEAIFLNE